MSPSSGAMASDWQTDAPAGRLTSATLDLQARVGDDGVSLGSADGTEHVRMQLLGFGRDSVTPPGPGRREGLTVHHDAIQQWWTTRDGFLEFGFVVDRADGPGDLRVDLAVPRVRVDGDLATLVGDTGSVDLLGLRAWDADGRFLESAFEELDGVLRLRIDVGSAVFPVTIDPLLDAPSWTATGSFGARLGAAVTSGDFNGDGLVDAAVGAPRAFHGLFWEGEVQIFLNTGSGLPSAPDHVLTGALPGARFGAALGAGDLDGDGLDDVVVGAPGWCSPEHDEGAVFVYSGADFSQILAWESDSVGALAGTSVAVGDALLVGAPGWSDSAWRQGAVFAWDDLSGPDWSLEGASARARLGRSVALGDVDGDGLEDAVLGAPGWRQTRYGEGAVRVVPGSVSGFTSVSWSAFGSQRGAQLGRSVDVSNGRILAGAPGWNGAHLDEGAAFAWDTLGSMPSWSLRSDQAWARLGHDVDLAGDLNGDGLDDLLLGAPRWDDGFTNEGAVFAVLGTTSGLSSVAQASSVGGEAYAHFGAAVAGVGDVDGDGLGDALIGAPDHNGSSWNEGQVALFGGAPTDFDGDGDPTHTDCDDADPAVHTLDLDGDGSTSCGDDCDDSTPQVGPGMPEACDGADNDCDGLVDAADPDFDTDVDGDGFLTDGCSVGGDDCDDNDGHVFPDDRETSGPLALCEPAARPGFAEDWHYARLSEANYFLDPVSGDHFLYFRGHADQAQQTIGLVTSSDGESWSEPIGPALSGGGAGAWDEQNTSNPAVLYLESAARPYLMLYHAKDTATGTRAVGLATATDPFGPFERLSVDGAPIGGPVLPPSVDPTHGDSFRTLHPAAWLDPVSGALHLWYNGRTAAETTLRIFHATSLDSGLTWTRTDVDGDGPDVVYEPTEAWHGDRTAQASVLPDPIDPEHLLFWFTGDQLAIGAAEGDPTSWSPVVDAPVFETASDCRRFDGAAVSARGIRHDPAEDAFHWYYTAQTDLLGCPDNEDPWYDNPWNTVSYVGHAVNPAPVVTLDAASATSVEGSLEDTFPHGVIVAVTSDVDGYLGTATVTPLAGYGTTDWTLTVSPPLSPGLHELWVDAVDEGGVVRSVSGAVTVP